jgi:hypothetical protein
MFLYNNKGQEQNLALCNHTGIPIAQIMRASCMHVKGRKSTRENDEPHIFLTHVHSLRKGKPRDPKPAAAARPSLPA